MAGQKQLNSLISTFLFLTAIALNTPAQAATEELNALLWCDNSSPDFLEPFEKATGIKVNVKEFEQTGVALSIVEQSQPGDWDVMIFDAVAIAQAVEKDLLAELPEDQLPFADLFEKVREDGIVNGKRYGITEKFGYNTISFNKNNVDLPDMQSLAVMTDPKYKGRIAIYDVYNAIIGLAALSIGKKTYELTEADLPALKEVLFKLKANAKLVGEITASQTALATGEVDILVGGGEWVTASLAKEKPALDFSIPKEGAMLWVQTLAIFKESKKKDLALKFIQYVLSPEGQARLATSSCYWGMPANTKATLTDEQKKVLRFDEQQEFLARAQPYPAPDSDLDKKMQDLWTEMLQAN